MIRALGICLGLMLALPAWSGTIYLVRHAEKMKGDDPGLTEKGQQRARWLADYLADKEIVDAWSTDTRRTMATLRPTARNLNLSIQQYDPSSLNEFADALLQRGVNAVVVGHSNTTPMLVNALLGEERLEWLSDDQYDRIFVVAIAEDGSARLHTESSAASVVVDGAD